MTLRLISLYTRPLCDSSVHVDPFSTTDIDTLRSKIKQWYTHLFTADAFSRSSIQMGAWLLA